MTRPLGPFVDDWTDAADPSGLRLRGQFAALAPLCYVISDIARDVPLGYACFWTVVRPTGVIEIGNVNLSPALQRTPIATEAFFLMIDWAFANGYRRMEWKCNALNAPSRRAAQRLGFSYEGVPVFSSEIRHRLRARVLTLDHRGIGQSRLHECEFCVFRATRNAAEELCGIIDRRGVVITVENLRDMA